MYGKKILQKFLIGTKERKCSKESVIKTLPKIASKFLFTSLRCKLSYQLPILISLRMGIKSQIEN